MNNMEDGRSGAADGGGLIRLAYSVAEAAALTGLGKTTLYALMEQGRLASCKVGKRRIIRRADLERLLSDQPGKAA